MSVSPETLQLGRVPTRLHQLHMDPDPSNGILDTDCCRTAFAMILGRPSPTDVPHLMNLADEDPEGRGWPAFKAWFAARGVQLVNIPLPKDWTIDEVERCLPGLLGRAPAVLTGRHATAAHCVAVIDGEIVDTYDNGDKRSLDRPCTDGSYWLTLLVPLPESAADDMGT